MDDCNSVTNDPVEQLGIQFAEYFHVDSRKQVGIFEDNIEDLLTKLDEYHGSLDMIRSDTSLCLQKTLPSVEAKSQEIQLVFEKIDKLEAFVNMVKQNMAALEDRLGKAESEIGSVNVVQKVFNSFSLPSFLNPKKQTSPPPTKPKPQYDPPVIFKMSDYFPASPSLPSPGTTIGSIRSKPQSPTGSQSPPRTIQMDQSDASRFDDQSDHQSVTFKEPMTNTPQCDKSGDADLQEQDSLVSKSQKSKPEIMDETSPQQESSLPETSAS